MKTFVLCLLLLVALSEAGPWGGWRRRFRRRRRPKPRVITLSNGDKWGGWAYCSKSKPCDKNYGDCDSDADCKSGLRCVSSNPNWPLDGRARDFCREAKPTKAPTPFVPKSECDTRKSPRILSAYYGYDSCIGIPGATQAERIANAKAKKCTVVNMGGQDISLVIPIAQVRMLCKNPTMPEYLDALPVVWNLPMDPTTALNASHYRVTMNTGEVVTPHCLTPFPNSEGLPFGEGLMQIVIGEFGDGLKDTKRPVKFEVVGDAYRFRKDFSKVNSKGAFIDFQRDFDYLKSYPHIIRADLHLFSTLLAKEQSTNMPGTPAIYPNHCGVRFPKTKYVVRVQWSAGVYRDGIFSIWPTDTNFVQIRLNDGTALGSKYVLGLGDLGPAGTLTPGYMGDGDQTIDVCLSGDVETDGLLYQISHVYTPCSKTGKTQLIAPNGFGACQEEQFNIEWEIPESGGDEDLVPAPALPWGENPFNMNGGTVTKLSHNVYWWGFAGSSSVIMVGTKEVTIINPIRAPFTPFLLAHLKNITSKPVTTLVYTTTVFSHAGGGRKSNFPKVKYVYAHPNFRRAVLTSKTGNYAEDFYLPNRYVGRRPRYVRRHGMPTLRLQYRGSFSTTGDLFAYIPAAKILILYDVVSPGWIPLQTFWFTMNYVNYLNAGKHILAFPFKTFIGGHYTRIGNRTDILVHNEYMKDVMGGMRAAMRDVPASRFSKNGFTNIARSVQGWVCHCAALVRTSSNNWGARLGGVYSPKHVERNCLAAYQVLQFS